MNGFQKLVRNKNIAWLLLSSIFFVTVLPVYYHIHHAHNNDLGSYSHQTELHVASHLNFNMGHDEVEHHGEATVIIDTMHKSITKLTDNNKIPIIFLIILLLSAALFQICADTGHKFNRNLRRVFPRYFSPPFRAPPVS